MYWCRLCTIPQTFPDITEVGGGKLNSPCSLLPNILCMYQGLHLLLANSCNNITSLNVNIQYKYYCTTNNHRMNTCIAYIQVAN